MRETSARLSTEQPHQPDTFRHTPIQILEGKFRGKRLIISASPKMQPTPRAVREELFDFLGSRVMEASFLDLCAGSGVIGLEALSRGAAHATFIERSTKFCSFIRKNLRMCGVREQNTDVLALEVEPFVRKSGEQNIEWDIAFFDPSTDGGYEEVFKVFEDHQILTDRTGVLAVSHKLEQEMPETVGKMRRAKTLELDDLCLSLYEFE